MKIKLFSLLLILLLLTACGQEPVSLPSEAPQEEMTFGQAVDTPTQAAQTTTMPSAPEEAPEEAPQGAPLAPVESEEVEYSPLHAQLSALILMKESDALSYQPEDPIATLRSLGYLVGLMQGEDDRIQVSGTAGTITPAMAEEYVKALFDDFSGALPAVTEEDPLVKKQGQNLEINLVELGELSLDCGSVIEEADGTMTVTATLTQDGRSLPGYTFTLTLSESSVFRYNVCSMERTPGA